MKKEKVRTTELSWFIYFTGISVENREMSRYLSLTNSLPLTLPRLSDEGKSSDAGKL